MKSIIIASLLLVGISTQAVAKPNGSWTAVERCVDGVCTGSSSVRLGGKNQGWKICYANGHRYFISAHRQCD